MLGGTVGYGEGIWCEWKAIYKDALIYMLKRVKALEYSGLQVRYVECHHHNLVF